MEQREIIIANKRFTDLNPLSFGRHKCPPGYTFQYNNIGRYLIHYVVSGKGKFYTGGMEYNVSPGEFFIIKKGENGRYVADDKDPWYYIWLGFDGKLSAQFRTLMPVTKLESDVFKDMLSVFDAGGMVEEMLTAYLFFLYRELFGEKVDTGYVARVKNFIDTNFSKNIKIEDIAKSLGLSRKYLSRIFKEETGMSMQQYLVNVRMKHAKKLLSEGVNVSETAILLSYEDQFSFSKMFKRHFGYPPSKYKKG